MSDAADASGIWRETSDASGRCGRPLPVWREGKPPELGLYFGFSTLPQRFGERPSLYEWNGKVWQHYTGWYDHGVTHWMATDLSAPSSDANPQGKG